MLRTHLDITQKTIVPYAIDLQSLVYFGFRREAKTDGSSVLEMFWTGQTFCLTTCGYKPLCMLELKYRIQYFTYFFFLRGLYLTCSINCN